MQSRFLMDSSKFFRMNLDMVYFLLEWPLKSYLIHIKRQ
nr:MAG TPA: hypothetical protein [Caudoviricetes sp.]